MENYIDSLEDRLKLIVDRSYQILREQIVHEKFIVHNEASLQLQFSVILNTIGQLMLYGSDEKFDIELEENIHLNRSTSKSTRGLSRCDICLRLHGGKNKRVLCAIELKFFKKTPNDTSTTNRYSILRDLENLENYYLDEKRCLRYEILYTNDKKYFLAPDNTNYDIGNGVDIKKGSHSYKLQNEVNLKHDYHLEWDVEEFGNNQGYFLKVEVMP